MTRDELMEDVRHEVAKVLPANEELSGEDLDTIQNTVEEVIDNATEALDQVKDDGGTEE